MQTFEIEVTLPGDPTQDMAWLETVFITTVDKIAAGNIALEVLAKRFDIDPLELFVSRAMLARKPESC